MRGWGAATCAIGSGTHKTPRSQGHDADADGLGGAGADWGWAPLPTHVTAGCGGATPAEVEGGRWRSGTACMAPAQGP